MTWTERTRYQASWGAWYVQIEIGNEICELKFDHSPTNAEIDPIAQQVWQSMQPPEPTIIPEDSMTFGSNFRWNNTTP